MNQLIFWGATGQAKVLKDALSSRDMKLLALFDMRNVPSPFPDVPIFQGEEGFLQWEQRHDSNGDVQSCIAIGGRRGLDRFKRTLWMESRGYPPLTVVHPTAFIATNAFVDAGCQVLAMSAVCAGAILGKAVIVNTKASVDHECVIGDGVHIAPGATLAGEVAVGEFAFIGAGAVVLPRLRIGANATIGAGAVVTRDVPPGETVAGNPARVLLQNP